MSNTWENYRQGLMDSARLKRTPLFGEFELTARCNLKCKMCYICRPENDTDARRKEWTASEWIGLAKKAHDAGMLYLLLTGGEVFIREDFKEIYEEIAGLGLIISLNTNATMITPKLARWLGRIPPNILTVTLYGASKETYKEVCGDESGYERTLRGIDLLMEEGIRVQVRTTIIRKNMADYMKMQELALSRGLELGIGNYVSPRREDLLMDPVKERLSPVEFLRFLSGIGYDLSKACEDDRSEQGIYLSRQEEAKSPFFCSCGKCDFWITWDGRMTPCALLGEPSVKVSPKHFKDNWERFQSLCEKVPSCAQCKACGHRDSCMTCPARLKIETGSFHQPAPYLCAIAKNIKHGISEAYTFDNIGTKENKTLSKGKEVANEAL